nr:energy-coupling factor transporter transmembrane protein EcfT [Chengkuizengella sediminis]
MHRTNPSFKFIVMIALFIYVLFIHNLNLMVNITILTLLLYLLFSGHSFKLLLLISIPLVLIFVSSATSMVFFGKGETTWFKWGLIHVTEESFYRGIHIGLRALTYAGLGIAFSLTTRPVYLFYSLMQQLKLPPKYAYSFLAALRMLPIMVEEFQTIRYALKVRGMRHKRGIKGIYGKLRSYAIPLLAQSIRRAHRVAVAMEAKRFSQVKNRTYYYKITFSRFDILFLLYFIVMLSAAYFLSEQLPYFPIIDVRYE